MTNEAVILVVDDEFLVLEAIRTTVQEIGYRNVLVAQNADDALRIALANRPDVILMDVALGGGGACDGVDVAEQIRRELEVPVVFVTARLDEATLARAKRFKPAGYITKPISNAQTLVTIELALYNSRQHVCADKHKTGAGRGIFVSYCHKDRRYFIQLQRHLRVLSQGTGVDVWDDTRIKPGAKWQSEIQTALRLAPVGILLISADFLISDFISSNELPAILESAERDGMLMLYLLVSPCNVPLTIRRFQAAAPLSRALSEMTVPERERVFSSVAAFIAHSVSP